MNEEIWKDVVGWEGYYQVSNKGRIKAIKRMVCFSSGRMREYPERVMNQRLTEKGYLIVSFTKNGATKGYRVNRLVAMAFLGLPNETQTDCMHLDDNRINNHVSNLRWGTHKENLQEAHSKNRMYVISHYFKGKTGAQHHSSKKVVQLDRLGNAIKVWDSMSEAAKKLNLFKTNISACCLKSTRTTGGFKWKLAS